MMPLVKATHCRGPLWWCFLVEVFLFENESISYIGDPYCVKVKKLKLTCCRLRDMCHQKQSKSKTMHVPLEVVSASAVNPDLINWIPVRNIAELCIINPL